MSMDNFIRLQVVETDLVSIEDFVLEFKKQVEQKKFPIRIKINEGPDISNLKITQEELDDLILLRSGKKTNGDKPDRRTNDYTGIEGYDPNLKFDEKVHAQYCKHIPIENLHGLTVDRIVEWKVGDVLAFDRQHLHCAGSGHSKKMGISVFTNRIHM